MLLEYNYYYFQKVLTPRFCNQVKNFAYSKIQQLAKIGGNKDKLSVKDLQKIRNSNIVWLDDDWIYKEIHPYIMDANKSAGWNFDIDFTEACQFTIYKKNQHYSWHADSWDKPYETKDITNGKIRKLSVTCSLSSPEEYKGGELEFFVSNPNKNKIHKCKEIYPQGSLVVFPSHLYHRVKPVTKGTRHSLVLWNLGYPFK